MIGTIISALIGRSIDRRDGDSGTTGTIVGALAPTVVKRVIPLAVLAGGVFAAKRFLDSRRGPDPLAS